MPNHRVLLLGLGFWGTNWMKTLSRFPDVKLAGISGAKSDADLLRQDYNLSDIPFFEDFREAIQQVDADILIIAIPTIYHTQAAELGMRRGMYILSEKPLASSIQEAKAAVELKRQFPDLVYMVDQNYRWRRHNQTIKKAIADGLIGKLGCIHYEFRQKEDLKGYREFLEMPLLQDVSIHHFDLMRFFTGSNARRILATSYRPDWSIFQGKPNTEAIIEMENGVMVNYNASWAARGRFTSWDGDITLTGDKGCLTLDNHDQVRLYTPETPEGELLEKVQMTHLELDYALNHMLNLIDHGGVAETTVEDNFHSYAMVCAGEESVASGGFVGVEGV